MKIRSVKSIKLAMTRNRKDKQKKNKKQSSASTTYWMDETHRQDWMQDANIMMMMTGPYPLVYGGTTNLELR